MTYRRDWFFKWHKVALERGRHRAPLQYLGRSVGALLEGEGAELTRQQAAALSVCSLHAKLESNRWNKPAHTSGMQVCPNGAKVRLNMGITERRYKNWNAALEHYLKAKELAGVGFCEPDYWIGVTRINQGIDIGRGAEVC